MRMTSLYDLDPAIGEPPPFAVAFHAHEYVHFLHNVSTTAGQAYLLSNLALLQVLARGADDEGYFKGLEKMDEEGRQSFQSLSAAMHAQQGTCIPKQVVPRGTNDWTCDQPELSVSEGVPSVTAVFRQQAMEESGEAHCASITVGLGFITEGVAYEVEREMRRLSGMLESDLDVQTSFFPYLAFRVLVRCWSGRDLIARDFILIGVAALAYPYAGQGLVEICTALRNLRLSVDKVLEVARAKFQVHSDHVIAALRDQRRDVSGGHGTSVAIGEYMALADAGVEMRRKFWAPELAFVVGHLTREEFRGRMGAMLDCLVLQEKPDKELELNWIGPGNVAIGDVTGQYLGSLQAALHFSQLHLKSDGGAFATEDLSRKAVECPFSRGCKSEKDDGYPPECKTAPWKRFTPSRPGEQVCWYAAGVKTVRMSRQGP